MATTTSTPIEWWNNLHENGPWRSRMFHNTALAAKADMPLPFDRYNDAAVEIQRLLAGALEKNEGFRAIGSGWSLSDIAHHSDQMQSNQLMNIKMAVIFYPYLQDMLFFKYSDIYRVSCFKATTLQFFFQTWPDNCSYISGQFAIRYFGCVKVNKQEKADEDQ